MTYADVMTIILIVQLSIVFLFLMFAPILRGDVATIFFKLVMGVQYMNIIAVVVLLIHQGIQQ